MQYWNVMVPPFIDSWFTPTFWKRWENDKTVWLKGHVCFGKQNRLYQSVSDILQYNLLEKLAPIELTATVR